MLRPPAAGLPAVRFCGSSRMRHCVDVELIAPQRWASCCATPAITAARRRNTSRRLGRSLSTLLLDASVILAAFDADDDLHEPTRAILADSKVTLSTLDLARYEVANVAVRAWRDPARVASLLEVVDRISEDGGVLTSTTALLTRAAQLAEEHAISVYDAAYVAGASQSGGKLVSCDTRDLISKGLASSPTHLSSGESLSAHEGAGH